MPCGGFFMFLLLGVMRANLPHYWDNNFLTAASNAMCIKIFSHSGCWEYQLFLILCQPWGLLCPLLSVILSPDPDSFLICKPRSVFQSRFEEIPLQSSGDIYIYIYIMKIWIYVLHLWSAASQLQLPWFPNFDLCLLPLVKPLGSS